MPARRCSPRAADQLEQACALFPAAQGYQVQLSRVSERRIVYQSGAQGITVLGESLALTPFTHAHEVKQ